MSTWPLPRDTYSSGSRLAEQPIEAADKLMHSTDRDHGLLLPLEALNYVETPPAPQQGSDPGIASLLLASVEQWMLAAATQ